MKKMIICLLLMLMLGLVGCEKEATIETLADSSIKEDVQEYIEEMLDETAKIDIFEKVSSETNDTDMVVVCNVLFGSDEEKEQGVFTLTYKKGEGEWILSKCRVELEEKEDSDDVDNVEQNQGEEETPGNDNTDSNSEIVMSDELYDYTFTLDGVVYKLPFAYTDLVENGWTISSTGVTESNTISGNSYESMYMAKNGNKIYVTVINLSGNTKELRACKVGGIDVYRSDILNNDFFYIAKGINTESSLDEIVAAFGSVNKSNTYSDYTVTTYEKDNYVYAKFYNYPDNIRYNQIILRNYVSDESDITETITDVPEYLSTYIAPEELGTDLLSGNIEIDGDLYCFPAPVSAFLENGWTVKSKNDSVGSGNTDYMTLTRNGKNLDISIANYAEYQTIPENCAVYSMYLYDDDKIPFEIAKGVTFDSTKEDIESVVSDEFSYYKGTNNYSYSYDDYDAGVQVTFYVDIETEKLSQITYRFKTWAY